ncbi:MAG: GTP-binding protein [archaeon]
MATISEQIKEIEDEIDKTPRNKGTEHHVGKLKAKLANLKEDKDKAISKKSGMSFHGYSVRKTGHATVVLVGYPSVGKSTILNAITNADSKIGYYDFTTLEVIPGMMEYNFAKIQILDIPGIVEEASSGKGKGKEIIAVARSADLVLIVTDVSKIGSIDTIKKELLNTGFRLNQERPDVEILKKDRGGITINSAVKQTRMDNDFIKSILNEFSIHNAEIILRENMTPDRLIDSVARNRVYVPMFAVINKIDMYKGDALALKKMVTEDCIFISADKNINMEKLKEKIFRSLNFMRFYMKHPGKEPDLKEPMIVRGKYSVLGLSEKIHKTMAKNFKFARIWGPSAKFGGQKVGPNHILKDGDIVELNFEK